MEGAEDDIIINRELLKVIGAESRISILKSLVSGRKTQSQLADELNLSSPTVLEHLDQLVNVGLVNKLDEGRKWKYYELSRKGRHLISPKQGMPARAMLMLGSGLLMLLFSGMMMFSSPLASAELAPAQTDTGGMLLTKSAPEAAAIAEPMLANDTLIQPVASPVFDLNGLFVQFVFVAGFVVFAYGAYILLRKRAKI